MHHASYGDWGYTTTRSGRASNRSVEPSPDPSRFNKTQYVPNRSNLCSSDHTTSIGNKIGSYSSNGGSPACALSCALPCSSLLLMNNSIYLCPMVFLCRAIASFASSGLQKKAMYPSPVALPSLLYVRQILSSKSCNPQRNQNLLLP